VVIIGLWLAVLGYGVAYAGQAKLSGKACSLQQAFSGACTEAAPKTTSAPAGQTAGQSASSLLAQQRAAVPTVPVMSA
jgi:hypothetical protein